MMLPLLMTDCDGEKSMTRSELIEILAEKNPNLLYRDVENSVKHMLEQMALTLEQGKRVEIRGFWKLLFTLPSTSMRTQS